MTKEKFVSILERIHKQTEDSNRIDKAIAESSLRELRDWFDPYALCMLNVDLVFDLLAEVMRDKYELIDYYYYDCNFQSNSDMVISISGNQVAYVSNFSDLYDAIELLNSMHIKHEEEIFINAV